MVPITIKVLSLRAGREEQGPLPAYVPGYLKFIRMFGVLYLELFRYDWDGYKAIFPIAEVCLWMESFS